MKKINTIVAFSLVLVFGITVFAGKVLAEETYLYVKTNGDLEFEVADNPTEAIADAENRDPNSGVLLTDVDPEIAVFTDNEENLYLYVDIYGNTALEVADNPTEAIADAENRDPNSGVFLVTE